tara:strand:- start:1140 stop:1940 length:801 start_codon:yes stop_codon:yes gene_type:complete
LIFKIIKNKFSKKKILEKSDFKNYLYDSFAEDSKTNKKFVNLGSGLFPHPYWTCVDIKSNNNNMYPEGFPEEYIDLNFNDSNIKLPFEDNSIEIFYSSHCLEHLYDRSILNLLKETFRSLKKDGLIRITCPDINLAINALKNNNKFFFDPENKNSDKNIYELFFLEWMDPACKNYFNFNFLEEGIEKKIIEEIDFLNLLFEIEKKLPLNGHINFLNEKKLSNILKNVGFKTIHNSRFGQSLSPVFYDNNFFEKNYQNLSLYIEAIK